MREKTKFDRGVMAAILLLLIGFLMVFIPYYELDNFKVGKFRIVVPEYDKLATFISGITAPFLSLSAFILLFLTYKSQKSELRASKDILQTQNKTQTLQRFETTFFNLINLHYTILNDIQISTDTDWDQAKKSVGRGAFHVLFEEYKKDFPRNRSSDSSESIKIIEGAGIAFFNTFSPVIIHYFNNVFNILKYIDEGGIENKNFYVDTFVAQLSKYELLLLFYFGLSDVMPPLRPFIEKYHLLRNLNLGDSLLATDHFQFYDSSAWKVM